MTSEAHIFVQNIPDFNGNSGNAEKNSEDISWFRDNCIWIGCVKHPLLLRENACLWVWIC